MKPVLEKKIFGSFCTYNNNINKAWFITYYVPDYTAGKMRKKQYKGEINKFVTVAERLTEMERIKKLIDTHQFLPNMQGARRKKPDEIDYNFAALPKLLYEALEVRKSTIDIRTYSDYKGKVQTLESWLFQRNLHQIPIGKIDYTIARDFIHDLKNKNYTNNTCNDYKVILGSLMAQCIKDLKLKMDNPFRDLPTLKKLVNPYRPYTLHYETIVTQNMPKYNPYLWLFIQLTHYCFIRSTEAYRLRIGNIDFYDKCIRIYGTESKNKKTRTVTIPEPLFAYMLELNIHQYEPDYLLFSKNEGPGTEPIGYNHFRNIWKKFRTEFNITVELKLYAWKHTGLIKLNRAGVPIKEIQMQVGHHSLDQLNQYITTMDASMLDNLRESFPKMGELPKRLQK